MSSLQINQVLAEMRALQARTTAPVGEGYTRTPGATDVTAQPADFASLLKSSVNDVANMQNQATAMASSYEAGDKNMDLTKVMLQVQKAGLAFHAMTEVRNKLVDAYTQVMGMSV